jgi:hypothetical protein
MTGPDKLLANAQRYAATFDKGDLPRTESVRGFVYNVQDGSLRELSA